MVTISRGRHEAAQHRRDRRRRGRDLDRKADRDHDQERDDEGFEEAKAPVHQQQQQESIERGDQRAADQGNAEQQFQRDRGAAEVIGTAIALKLLFGIPLIGGALITALDAFLLLLLMNRGFRFLEAFVIALLIVIAVCFAIQIAAAAPPVAAMLRGFVPSTEIVTNPEMLYIAIGIIGATVMPHNLYLHSSIVQTRAYERTDEGRRDAIKWATTDSTIALMLALFINAAILIVAAATFHASGHADVAEIGQAFELLSPLLGLGIASTLFAVALLASGLNSTVTATLAGQIVMEGFLHLRLPSWARRLVTRGIAIVPVVDRHRALWRARHRRSCWCSARSSCRCSCRSR